MGWLLLTVWLGQTTTPYAPGDRAEVVAEALDVFDAPAPTAYSVARLRNGDEVVVRGGGPRGWLAIDPPAGSFQWIDEDTVEVRRNVAIVTADRATLRSARDDARMPGPPAAELATGAALRLVDHEPLVLRQGRRQRTWLAVEPPAGLLYHVRADGVAPPGAAAAPHPTARRTALDSPIEPGLVSIGRPAPDDLPGSLAAALSRVEDDHRRELRRPLESWDLGPIRGRYQALLERSDGDALRPIIRERLARLEAQQATANAARRFVQALKESRQADQESMARAAFGTTGGDEPFDATGLLEPSSRLVDGQRVFALIGPEGYAIAYLRPVPGVDARRYLGRRVGVHGPSRYDETVRAKVITVEALEPLAVRP